MPPSDIQELYRRLNLVEITNATTAEQIRNLTNATKDNTNALEGVTEALTDISTSLSYNKGAIATAFKAAAIGTTLIAGLFAFITWIAGLLHFGPASK